MRVGIRREVRRYFKATNSGSKTGISKDMIRARIADNNIREEINKINLKKKRDFKFFSFHRMLRFFLI
jgi:hypothetical protein